MYGYCGCCWQLELRERQKRQQAEYEAQHPGAKVSKKKTYTDKYLEEFLPPPEPESVIVLLYNLVHLLSSTMKPACLSVVQHC